MEKKNLSAEKEKIFKNWMRDVIKEEKKTSSTSKEPGHKTLSERMLCKDCNPKEEYVKAHLQLMGQKKCKECGNIDREKQEFCSDCGEDYS